MINHTCLTGYTKVKIQVYIILKGHAHIKDLRISYLKLTQTVTITFTTKALCTSFCRGFGAIGPFVDMVYKMCAGDMSRFGIIYIIFVLGLAQGRNWSSQR